MPQSLRPESAPAPPGSGTGFRLGQSRRREKFLGTRRYWDRQSPRICGEEGCLPSLRSLSINFQTADAAVTGLHCELMGTDLEPCLFGSLSGLANQALWPRQVI